MKKFWYTAVVALAVALIASSCRSASSRDGRLPAEDLEVQDKCADTLAILRDPSIPCNSEAKYRAAQLLIREVDLTFTRETKTINELFYHGDALYDDINAANRTITFNFQEGDHYVRIIFHTFRNFVLRVDVQEK